MRHQIAKSDLSVPNGAICFASILLLALAVPSTAQVELRADKQILLETTHGTQTIKKGPGDKLYVLTRSVKPPSSLWISDYSGSSMRQILNGGSEPTDLLRFPKDFAVGRDGNVIVLDAGLIKTFSPGGELLSTFPFKTPESVGVLSDNRILVSGQPKDGLIAIFDRQGRLLGQIGEPVKVDDASGPGFNAVLNIGTIVVDENDNIYFIFRHLLTPTVRKYTREGKLAAEWHPKSTYLDQVTTQARNKYEESKEKRDSSGISVLTVLTSGAFDAETKTLWVASGPQVLQLDSSGETIRSFDLVRPEGGPVQAFGLLVDRDFIRAAGPLHGTFEFLKPR